MAKGTHKNHPKADRQHRWSNDRMIGSNGYVKLRVGRGHPLADPNGYAYEHTVIWVAAGNPRPKRGEVLRHKNEVKSDSRIENLVLFTRTKHSRTNMSSVLKDPRGRMMTKAASRAVRAGAAVRFHYAEDLP